MKKIDSKYHKGLAALIIILSLSGVLIASHLTGVLDYVEFKIYDLRINLFADFSRPSDDIVVVLLDQESIEWGQREQGWGWPWPRKAYADFVDYMKLGNAKSVAFDVLFSEPSIYRNSRQDEIIEEAIKNLEMAQTVIAEGQPRAAGSLFMQMARNLQNLNAREDDASFAGAEMNFGRVVQGVFFSTVSGSDKTWPADLRKPLFKTENFDSVISLFDLANDMGEESRAQFPIRELRNAAGAIGALTGQADSDSVIRRHRLFTVFDNRAVPGLAAASLLVSGEDEAISYDPAKKLIRWGGYSIPVDKDGKCLLRYRGSLDRYNPYSVSTILQSAEDLAAGREPTLYPEDFEGAYVFFGFFAPGLFDIFNTPISSVYPGMGVHITLLDNILMNDFIKKIPDWLELCIIAVSVIMIVLLVFYSGRVPIAIAGLIAAIAAEIATGFLAFNAGNWVPLAAPLIAAILAFLSATLYNYATEGKDKRFIKSAFSRIISPKVVDQIIADPSQLKLGGESRKLTAIFTDIQRFSTISSELQDHYSEDGPQMLVNLLNLYLTEMSNIILANEGTVDKYEGDAIIAFFGAPVWVEDHAVRACRSAIQMKKRELTLRQEIMNPEGKFYAPLNKLIGTGVIRKERPLYTRLGLNSGDMVVGFMGAHDKMDYTIMGNAVNLAARLEGVNKQYDTKGILISEYTRSLIGDEFIIRPLSRVTVVGIPVPVRLYELLDTRDEAGPDLLKAVKAWEGAFKAYEEKNFEDAKKIFAAVYKDDPEDQTANLYFQRCEEFIAAPPSGWDGVDNLTEK
jgi:class 3 adenylate cyclase/CHASE2 domain-containing sensor protein